MLSPWLSCGITSPKDAALDAEVGANLIGMIIWPNSKRSISLSMATEISRVAREDGADAAGVFVDDVARTILIASEALDLKYMQIIYVLHADENGVLLNSVSDEKSFLAYWISVDGKTGGSG